MREMSSLNFHPSSCQSALSSPRRTSPFFQEIRAKGMVGAGGRNVFRVDVRPFVRLVHICNHVAIACNQSDTLVRRPIRKKAPSLSFPPATRPLACTYESNPFIFFFHAHSSHSVAQSSLPSLPPSPTVWPTNIRLCRLSSPPRLPRGLYTLCVYYSRGHIYSCLIRLETNFCCCVT